MTLKTPGVAEDAKIPVVIEVIVDAAGSSVQVYAALDFTSGNLAHWLGKAVVVEGDVIAVKMAPKKQDAMILDFHQAFGEQLAVIIPENLFSVLPPDEIRKFQGRKIRVFGTVEEWRKAPRIKLKDLAHIQDRGPAAAAPTDSAPPVEHQH